MSSITKTGNQQTTEPASLLSHWWTMGKMALDRRTKGRHLKVGWVIMERFMRAKGGGRASIRFIQQATGLSGRIVVQACNELVEWDYCSRIVGVGTRPTECAPSWATVSPMYSAKSVEPSVPQECNASASPMCNANDASASPMCSESFLRNRLTKPDYGKEGEIDCAALPGNAGAASAPGVPEGGQEGFEALWLAYDFRKRRAEARAAYAKLNPNAATQARLLTAAVAWRKAWEAQDKPNAPRKYLYSWLAEECFEEDAPGKPLASPTRKAKAATKSKLLKADNDNQHSSQSGWERVQIVASKIVPLEDGGRKLMMLMRADDGGGASDTIILEHPDYPTQADGEQHFASLCQAVRVEATEDSDDLHGIAFERRVIDGRREYRAVAQEAA